MNRATEARRSKQTIYPIFLPHAGCPFQCVYCNQNSVTSGHRARLPAAALMEHFEQKFAALLEQINGAGSPGEIAFYGGTFTAISNAELRHILDTVSPWVERGVFTGIRFSTRPDCMGREVRSLLADYPVKTVELGVQTLCDQVLNESRRGYSSEKIKEAADSIQKMGWQLGIQLMPGLPGDNRSRFIDSVRRTIELSPGFVRLYPTIVLNKTVLADWYQRGIYQPLSLDEAVDWCTAAYEMFLQAEIGIARMGLHADPELETPGNILAGPYHPAFGYLVKVRWWRRQVDRRLADYRRGEKRSLLLRIPQRFISEALGPQKANIYYWLKKWQFDEVKVKAEADWSSNRFEAILQ